MRKGGHSFVELDLIDGRFKELDTGYGWMVNFLEGGNLKEDLG